MDKLKFNTKDHALILADTLDEVSVTGEITLSVTDATLAAKALRAFAPQMHADEA